MSTSAADRKRRQRARERADGYVEITLRVPADAVAAVRDFVAQLPPPAPPVDPRQLDLAISPDSTAASPDAGRGAP